MKNIAIEIKKRINEFLEKDGKALPKRGILTGQSVATLYLDLIGFNKYKANKQTKNIINDVDVFIVTKKRHKSESGFMEKEDNTKIDYIADYGRFLGHYAYNKYMVVATRNIGALNITFVSSNEEIDAEILISKFDINCTQIAIDLETNELIMSKHFEEFVKSGQLRIVDLATPMHSAIRLAKKASEFGLHVDYDREYSKLYILGNKCRFFADKYYKNYLRNKDIIDRYFDLTECNTDDWKNEYNTTVYKHEKLYSLNKKEELFKEYRSFHNNVGFYFPESVLRTNNMYWGSNETKRTSIVEKFSQKEYIDKYSYPSYVHFMVEKFQTRSIAIENFKHIFKVIKEHPRMAPVYYSLSNFTELAQFHNNFKTLCREKGLSIIGVLENTRKDIPSSLEGLRELYKTEIGDLTAELINKSVNTFKFFYWEFNELNTTLELMDEGKKQSHCVGGYTKSVESGRSRIIALTPLSHLEKAYTIELRMYDDNKFYIAQCMAKYNKPLNNQRWLESFAKEITKNSNINVKTYEEYTKNTINQNFTYIPEVDIDEDIPF